MIAEILQVKKLSNCAIIPTRGSQYAAGFDLSSAYDTIVSSHGKCVVQTDLSISIPKNTYARIAPRSGLAVKNFIDTGAGVIDYDYRGAVGVVLFNHSDNDFIIKRGDRIAQLILERICMADIEEVIELSVTDRGEEGFGSTGIKIKSFEKN
jgi:dUTP pyrophosphatase